MKNKPKSSDGKGIKENNFEELKKDFFTKFCRSSGCIDEEIDEVWNYILSKIKNEVQKSYWSGIKVMENEYKLCLNPLKKEIKEAIEDWSSLSETRRIYKTKVLGILTQILEDLNQL